MEKSTRIRTLSKQLFFMNEMLDLTSEGKKSFLWPFSCIKRERYLSSQVYQSNISWVFPEMYKYKKQQVK